MGKTAKSEESGGASAGPKTPHGYAEALASGSWRTVLRTFAELRWRDPQSAVPAEVTDSLTRQLGPARASDSLGLIAQLATGKSKHGSATTLPAAIARQVEIVLDGLSSAHHARPEASRPLFQIGLWQMLRDMRESADISYTRSLPINELDRRILLLLEARKGMTPAELSATTGVDKAQVSRSVKRLDQAALIARETIRSPLRLSEGGRALTQRLQRLAALRNRELTFGISDSDLSAFFTHIEAILPRAIALYEIERLRAADGEAPDTPDEVEATVGRSAIGEMVLIDRSRIVPPLIALNAYVLRGGSLAFKRVTGLSNFESWVLNEIALDPPVSWTDLARSVQRDHSQAGRTVNHLIELGLVRREGEPGRRHGRFLPTALGRQAHAKIIEVATERSEFLIKAIPQADREAFFETFDRIWHNARAQLERERAAEELRS